MNSEELHDVATDLIDLAESLSQARNADGETTVRGLYLMAASIASLSAAAYEIASALKEDSSS